jgi:carbon-monoxide dehydrogenase small subunit
LRTLEFTLNGKPTRVEVRQNEVLTDVLRERLGLLATKVSCDEGTCGSCTVLLDGKPVYACMLLALDCRDRSVETLEGLSNDPKDLHPLQQAFVTTNASQCGFCTPGMIMSAKALLAENPNPSREEVKVALSGNICRCTDYSRYIDAVLVASRELAASSSSRAKNGANQ